MARKQAEEYVLSVMDSIDPSGVNKAIYKKRFKEMSDAEFEIFISEVEAGTNSLMVNASGDAILSHDRNLKVLKQMNVPVFQKVTIDDGNGKYKPNIEYLILKYPFRRAQQHIKKNFSVHADLKSRNSNTGQVTGKSKAGSITYPEAQLISALGLKHVATELLGVRGGDVQASHAYASLLFKNGMVTAKEMEQYRSKTGGTIYIKALFKAKHLDIVV